MEEEKGGKNKMQYLKIFCLVLVIFVRCFHHILFLVKYKLSYIKVKVPKMMHNPLSLWPSAFMFFLKNNTH